MTADKLFTIPPFSLSKTDKSALLLPMLEQLVKRHSGNCKPFDQYIKAAGFKTSGYNNID